MAFLAMLGYSIRIRKKLKDELKGVYAYNDEISENSSESEI